MAVSAAQQPRQPLPSPPHATQSVVGAWSDDSKILNRLLGRSLHYGRFSNKIRRSNASGSSKKINFRQAETANERDEEVKSVRVAIDFFQAEPRLMYRWHNLL